MIINIREKFWAGHVLHHHYHYGIFQQLALDSLGECRRDLTVTCISWGRRHKLRLEMRRRASRGDYRRSLDLWGR